MMRAGAVVDVPEHVAGIVRGVEGDEEEVERLAFQQPEAGVELAPDPAAHALHEVAHALRRVHVGVVGRAAGTARERVVPERLDQRVGQVRRCRPRHGVVVDAQMRHPVDDLEPVQARIEEAVRRIDHADPVAGLGQAHPEWLCDDVLGPDVAGPDRSKDRSA